MNNSQSKIDLSSFIGQKVEEVNPDDNVPLCLTFERGWLVVECAWRVRHQDRGVQVGKPDCTYAKDKFSYKTVESMLVGRAITNIWLYEPVADLTIEFDKCIYLDAFHDCAYFEGWQMGGEDNISFWTDPGGKLGYPINNPLVPKDE